jgi:hypothetical protein
MLTRMAVNLRNEVAFPFATDMMPSAIAECAVFNSAP